MRTSLRRALAAATATVAASAALLVGATPASALDSTVCPQATSTRLLTANDGEYKVWLYQPADGTVYVCFVAGPTYGGGVLMFRTGLTGSLIPSVIPDPDASDCDSYLHLQDPVDVEIEFGWTAWLPPFYLCFGVEGTAVGLTVTAANGSVNPSVELWLDAASGLCTLVTNYYCSTATRIFSL